MNKLTCCLALFAMASAFAQDVPPPPRPPDGPTLDVTMKYIHDRLNAQGKVRYQMMTMGDDGSVLYTIQVSRSAINAVADVESCTLSFKEVSTFDGGQSEVDYKVSFRDVDKLLVESVQDWSDRVVTAAGLRANDKSSLAFQVTLVLSSGKTIPRRERDTDPKGVVTEKDGQPFKDVAVYFREEDAAQRMAKAMVHAVELCGGGNKDPF